MLAYYLILSDQFYNLGNELRIKLQLVQLVQRVQIKHAPTSLLFYRTAKCKTLMNWRIIFLPKGVFHEILILLISSLETLSMQKY